jgi:hypothetical protein
VTLQPTEEGATLGAVTELVLRGQAYHSADEAAQAAARWRGLIQKAFARLNVPANFGDRAAGGGFFFRPALQMLEEQAGQPVFNDVHGTIVFECDPAPLFARLGGASYHKGVNVGRLQAAITTATKLGAVMSDREQLAYDLYSAAAAEASADARLVMLMMAVETLIEQEPRSETARALVDRLIAETRAAALPSSENESIVGVLDWLHRESIGQAGRRLAARLGDRRYVDRSPSRFFTECYELRSALVHGRYPRPIRAEVEQHAGPLELFVRDLLSLELIDAMPE